MIRSNKYNLNQSGDSNPHDNILDGSNNKTLTKESLMLINVNELSHIFSISTSMVYKLVEENRIPHYRLGKAVRFSLCEIRNWLESQHRKPQFLGLENSRLEKNVDILLGSTIIGSKL
jgi:excisionase family DNA binding protein